MARWTPGARVVNAFNSIGMEVMANPVFANGRSVLWHRGDDSAACDVVASLARDIRFDPICLAPLARARVLEPSALRWITGSGVMGTREFSWRVLRR